MDTLDLTLESSTFSSNVAGEMGGGLAADGTSLVTIQAGFFATNSARGSGGALALVGGDLAVVVDASTLVANDAAGGGGVAAVLAGTLDVTASTLEGNTPSDVAATTPFNAPLVSPVAFTCTAAGCVSAL